MTLDAIVALADAKHLPRQLMGAKGGSNGEFMGAKGGGTTTQGDSMQQGDSTEQVISTE